MAAIIDSAGNLVVEYKYDAWGNITHMFGSLASTLGEMNPFRYRGYVYDVESGLYYLRSRYYNPEWGRFISSDAVLGKVGGASAHNVYCYCHNNPVSYFDSNGCYEIPVAHFDVNGRLDYYIYTYSHEVLDLQFSNPGFLPYGAVAYTTPRTITGHVYIYVNLDDVGREFFDNPENHPEGFDPENDIMIGYFPDYKKPAKTTMYAYQAHRLNPVNRLSVVKCMISFDQTFDTLWDRQSIGSLLTEWTGHHAFYPFSRRAQDIDFDNAEDGKSFGYFVWKAILAFLGMK